jgi:hypothetical protein
VEFLIGLQNLGLCNLRKPSGIAGNRTLSEERGSALGIGASEPAPVNGGTCRSLR